MTQAWFALAGVAIGGLLTGIWTLFVHNSGLAGAQRDALLTRLDGLLRAVADVEAGVQRFMTFATLYLNTLDSVEKARLLEQAGAASGDIAVEVSIVTVIAREVDGEGSLFTTASSYAESARAVTSAPVPAHSGEESPAQKAFVAKRSAIVAELGKRMGEVRSTPVPFSDRVRGRFSG